MLSSKKVGFIGGGFMAEAIIKGLTSSGSLVGSSIAVADVLSERLNYLHEEYGVEVAEDNSHAATGVDVLLLAVKPPFVTDVLAEVAGQLPADAIIISIAAGVKLGSISAAYSGKVVRVMPNTPAQCGVGVTAISYGDKLTEEDKQTVRQLFGSVGVVVDVDETLMDGVTAVSGSGPAYVALFAESLISGGLSVGLPADVARTLAIETIRGAAETMLQTDMEPEALRKSVTSPGGTTAAALSVLGAGGFSQIIIDAVNAAAYRSKELG